MKGKITIEATENQLQCSGSMYFKREIEPYIVVRSVAKSLGISTPEQWARLVVLAMTASSEHEKLEQTRIEIPRPPEHT